MVCRSFIEYEELAVRLASPPYRHTELLQLREKINRNRLTEPLFDTQKWVKHFEIGLLEAWRVYTEEGF